MALNAGLPVALIVAVSVAITPSGTPTPNFNTGLIMGSSSVIDTVTRMRTYSSLTAVANDFGTAAPEYLAAQEWFTQLPKPTTLNIGRWAQAATNGQLYCAPLSAANSLLSAWTAVTNGSFTINLNAAGSQAITGLDFHLQTTLNGVAGVIQTALRAIGTGGYTLATVVYNSVQNRFVISSGTTGASSTVSFLTTGGGGTDISAQLGGTATSSGAYVANGIAAESYLSAVTILDTQYGGSWYELVTLGAADADVEAIAPYIEAAGIALHYYFVNTQEAGVITQGDTSNIAFILKQTGYNHTAVQYSSTSLYAATSLAARMVTVNWSGQNTTLTLMFKQEPGIVAETLTTTQLTQLLSNNANVYTNYNNVQAAGVTPIIQPGVATSGIFIDSIVGVDVLAATIQAGIFNVLLSQPKVPLTDAGQGLLGTSIGASLQQFSTGAGNGLLGPGVWNAAGFGQLKTGDWMATGSYVYQPPITSQTQAQRIARQSVAFQVAAKLAEATQSVSILLNVNQ
jgi:hypothetical protein